MKLDGMLQLVMLSRCIVLLFAPTLVVVESVGCCRSTRRRDAGLT